MGGLLGRDNPLGSAFELINKRIEEEAEAEKRKASFDLLECNEELLKLH